MTKGTILIVEDEEKIRNTLQRSLQRAGYRVITTGNGKEALRVNMEKIDLLITDVFMPEINGIEMLKELKNQGKNIKTLVISSSSAYKIKEFIKASDLTVCSILQKPLLNTSIIEVVKKLMAGS